MHRPDPVAVNDEDLIPALWEDELRVPLVELAAFDLDATEELLKALWQRGLQLREESAEAVAEIERDIASLSNRLRASAALRELG